MSEYYLTSSLSSDLALS